MLAGGEDPRYINRRLIRFAVEDIGMAVEIDVSHGRAFRGSGGKVRELIEDETLSHTNLRSKV